MYTSSRDNSSLGEEGKLYLERALSDKLGFCYFGISDTVKHRD